MLENVLICYITLRLKISQQNLKHIRLLFIFKPVNAAICDTICVLLCLLLLLLGCGFFFVCAFNVLGSLQRSQDSRCVSDVEVRSTTSTS